MTDPCETCGVEPATVEVAELVRVPGRGGGRVVFHAWCWGCEPDWSKAERAERARLAREGRRR